MLDKATKHILNVGMWVVCVWYKQLQLYYWRLSSKYYTCEKRDRWRGWDRKRVCLSRPKVTDPLHAIHQSNIHPSHTCSAQGRRHRRNIRLLCWKNGADSKHQEKKTTGREFKPKLGETHRALNTSLRGFQQVGVDGLNRHSMFAGLFWAVTPLNKWSVSVHILWI